jgi:zinc-ribbon domain
MSKLEKDALKSAIRNPESEIPTMPDPEIARRCSSCGVSIRVRASFCPQCGKPLTPKQDAATDAKDSRALASDFGTPEPADLSTMPLDSEDLIPPSTALSTPPSDRKQPRQATVGMVYRADSPPRQARPPREVIGDDGLNRVQKFRQISSAMIGEAAYDPSLRFLLVAAVLFVLFIFLLILSELIT